MITTIDRTYFIKSGALSGYNQRILDEIESMKSEEDCEGEDGEQSNKEKKNGKSKSDQSKENGERTQQVGDRVNTDDSDTGDLCERDGEEVIKNDESTKIVNNNKQRWTY